MKKETLQEASQRYSYGGREGGHRTPFLEGVKWQMERSYSEDEVLHILDTFWDRLDIWYNSEIETEFNLKHWFNKCELKKII